MSDEKSAPEKSALYREALLEHARHPKHHGRLAEPQFTASASNPLCGDELELTLRLAEGNIEELGFAVRGCTIVQAAASMVGETIAGMGLEAARALGDQFRAAMESPRATMENPQTAMKDSGDALPPGLEALAPLTAVKQHRSRIRCALLPWDALDACGADSEDG